MIALVVFGFTSFAGAQTTLSAKAAKKVAEQQDKLAVLQATLPVVVAEAAIKIAAATGNAEVDRILHAPSQEREDNEVKRDNSRDDHRPTFGYFSCLQSGIGCGVSSSVVVVNQNNGHELRRGGYESGVVIEQRGNGHESRR